MLNPFCVAQEKKFIYKKHEIEGGISPKSIVSSGNGLFAAQNMMYRHSVTLYDKNGNLLAKIPDLVNLNAFGFEEYESDSYLGGPVEAAFSHSGNYLWVSNYNMIGKGFNNPGCDGCNGKAYDPGFVYKINTSTFKIENAIKVGAVPKYLAISNDEHIMIVSNWSSSDISIVDLKTEKEIKKVDVGVHPRGVAISSDSKKAYVTVMGSTKIAIVDLVSYEVNYILGIGNSPRHVVLSENDSLLYISLNSGNALVKYDLANGTKQVCKTAAGPRSMIISPDQNFLYVVNYFNNTFSKIRTDSMTVMEVVNTSNHPIGITANWDDSEIWVACYEGKIEIFKDFSLAESVHQETFFFEEELAIFLSLFQTPNGSDKTGEVKPEDTKESKNVIVDDENDEDSLNDKIIKTEAVSVGPSVNSASLAKLDPSKYPSKNQNKNAVNCSYHVIVGSFSVYENAVNFKNTVEGKGYPAQIIQGNKGLTYVSAQCFLDKESANNGITAIYKDLDVKGWVLNR